MIGCIIGGIISGVFSNRSGRKKTLLMAAVLSFISAFGSGYPETKETSLEEMESLWKK
ncbi:MAG TPA: MFS transporter [Petrimonas sp.]|uniref:MFS transporter n=1 Tax=Petrimonas sp. TaxID=2023866 RepID=UPI0017783368|nr:MFS transporter [Petrimonas sp.]MEA5063335.1 MFS transporter [Petrimonas sp.]HHV84254.1 MFS transporter [Petrimonas sp.]